MKITVRVELAPKAVAVSVDGVNPETVVDFGVTAAEPKAEEETYNSVPSASADTEPKEEDKEEKEEKKEEEEEEKEEKEEVEPPQT